MKSKFKVGDIIFIKDEVNYISPISPFKILRVRQYSYDVMELRSKFIYEKVNLDTCKKATKQELNKILVKEI